MGKKKKAELTRMRFVDALPITDEEKERAHADITKLLENTARMLTMEIEHTKAQNFVAIAFNDPRGDGQDQHYLMSWQRVGKLSPIQRAEALEEELERTKETLGEVLADGVRIRRIAVAARAWAAVRESEDADARQRAEKTLLDTLAE